MHIAYGRTSEWGFALKYNPDYKDISIDFIKWYFAIGIGKDKWNSAQVCSSGSSWELELITSQHG